MDAATLGQIFNGFAIALQPTLLFFLFIGLVIGTAVGIFPGIGPAGTIGVLIPITFGMDPTAAVIMMGGIYYGAKYSGAIVAILMRVPGDTSTLFTCIDGYALNEKGRARQAITISAIASFVGGTAAVVGFTLLAVPLSRLGLTFSAPEYFSLLVLAFVLLAGLGNVKASIVGGEPPSVLKGLVAVALGLGIATIGTDPSGAVFRYTFGLPNLIDGIDFIVAALGLFVIPDILVRITEKFTDTSGNAAKQQRGFLPTLQELRDSIGPIWRGSVSGFFVGILPGAGASVATPIAYGIEQRRDPERVGKGAMAGVAGPEAADNAAVSASFIPFMTLGIPGSKTTALLFGAFMIYGLRPGPLLIQENPEFVWSIIASMYVGNVAMLLIIMPIAVVLCGYVAKVTYDYLYPIILLMLFLGVFSLQEHLFDVGVMIGFGVLGYVLEKVNVPMTPLVIALILGPMVEQYLSISLTMALGNPLIFLTRPASASMLAVAAFLLVLPIIQRAIKRSKQEAGRQTISN